MAPLKLTACPGVGLVGVKVKRAARVPPPPVPGSVTVTRRLPLAPGHALLPAVTVLLPALVQVIETVEPVEPPTIVPPPAPQVQPAESGLQPEALAVIVAGTLTVVVLEPPSVIVGVCVVPLMISAESRATTLSSEAPRRTRSFG